VHLIPATSCSVYDTCEKCISAGCAKWVDDCIGEYGNGCKGTSDPGLGCTLGTCDCDYTLADCGACENPGDFCTQDSQCCEGYECILTTEVATGAWYGTCQKPCSRLCEEAGYKYLGCKCDPEEVGPINFDTDGCDQNICTPDICACTEFSDCGGECGPTSCKPDETCVVTGTTGGVANCQFNEGCDICTETRCGEIYENQGGVTYYCVYDGGDWKWSTSIPDNFCCDDSDCEGKSPRPTCEAQGYPNRYAKCDFVDKKYRCERCDPCHSTKTDCKDGFCCVGDPTGPKVSVTDSNYGQCYPLAGFKRIYSPDSKYLCAS